MEPIALRRHPARRPRSSLYPPGGIASLVTGPTRERDPLIVTQVDFDEVAMVGEVAMPPDGASAPGTFEAVFSATEREGDAAIEIDKVRDRRLRPSVLVAALARAQERGVRFKAEAFLDSLRSTYELLVASGGKRPDAVVRLVDIWSVLTMLPGQRVQYSKQEFARDLYLLDQSGVTRTARSPRTLRWAASTGTKGAGTLVTVGRNGQQQRYWG